MNTRCGKCGADLQIDPSMVGKRLECPACHHSFHLQAMPGTEPVAQTRRFRPFEPRPIADAQPHVVDPGGRGLPPHMRNYGRLGVCFCGLVLAALFLVPLDLTPDAQPVFWWQYAELGLPTGAFTVALVLSSLGAMAALCGIALRGAVLGMLAFAMGVGGALTWLLVLRSHVGAMAGPIRAPDLCLLVGIPVALIGLRLRAIFERGIMGRLWFVPGMVLLILGCLLPVAGALPVVESLRDIKVDAQAGVYIGAGVAVVFGVIALLPGASGSAMMGFTGLVLGVMSPFVRRMIESVMSLAGQVREANAALIRDGQEAIVKLESSQVLDEALLPLGVPMVRILGLLVLTVYGGVLLLAAVTTRPKSAATPAPDAHV